MARMGKLHVGKSKFKARPSGKVAKVLRKRGKLSRGGTRR